jgi:hypothetical protein
MVKWFIWSVERGQSILKDWFEVKILPDVNKKAKCAKNCLQNSLRTIRVLSATIQIN